MFALSKSFPGISKAELYAELQRQALGLLEGERDPIANAANLSSLIFHTLPDLNWVGFYRLLAGELVLGPFHGKPACVRIALGRGVCGTAARDRRTIVVPNVDEFPGHIACDSASRSEVVIPIVHQDKVLGVLDLDSPKLARFDETDARGLEAIVHLYTQASGVGG